MTFHTFEENVVFTCLADFVSKESRGTEEPEVAVLNTVNGKFIEKCRLRKTTFAANRNLPDVNEHLDPGVV